MSEGLTTTNNVKIVESKPTLQKFDEITNKWVNLTVQAFNLESMKEDFRQVLPKEGIDELENAHVQAQDFIDAELRGKLQETKEKYQLNKKMQHLDLLIKEAKDRPPVERSILPTADRVVRSVLYEAQEKKKTRLQEELQTLEAENSLLIEQLTQKKKELKDEFKDINETLEDAEKALEIVFDIPIDDAIEMSIRLDTANI